MTFAAERLWCYHNFHSLILANTREKEEVVVQLGMQNIWTELADACKFGH